MIYGTADVSLEQAPLALYWSGEISRITYSQQFVFMEMKPQLVPVLYNIIYPLDKTTWFLIMVSLFAISITLLIVSTFSKKMVRP